MVCVGSGVLAQERCNAVEAEQYRKNKYKFLPDNLQFEQWMSKKIMERRSKLIPYGTNEVGDPDKIAVVVHVIHNGEPYGEGINITDEQIYSQIEVLNEDYQRKNADTIHTQPEFLDLASKLNIEFVLARQTIDGNPTTGIIRQKGTKDSYNISISDRELLSNISHWDPNVYLNIWVTDLRSPYIGLAQFPDYNYPGLDTETDKDNEATDGMVIDYQAFGSVIKVPGLDLNSSYNLGRTSTHEIAHFLGLKHVWGDQTGTSGCSVDDFVSDTPMSSKDYSGSCTPTDHLTCGSNDMFENFLYYTNDACMNIFTAGQVERMQVILENAPRRTSLLNSIGTEYSDNEYVDLAINSIKSPGKVICTREALPIIEVKNNGTVPIKEFSLKYVLNGAEQSYEYNGDTIQSGELVDLELNQITLSSGMNKMEIELENVIGDINGVNNKINHVFSMDDQTDFIPLREQFESADLDLTNWITINEDEDIGWEIESAPMESQGNTAAYINLYNYESRQQQDWLISPMLDFSQVRQASISFKTSYAKNLQFSDQLQVLASKNCGVDFNDILNTYSSDDLSVENLEDFWEPSGSADWKSFSLDLQEYAGEEQVRLAFLVTNDFGGNLYLDDIEFFATSEDMVVKTDPNDFVIFPNPTVSRLAKLAFNTGERQEITVYIYDSLGKLVVLSSFPNTLNQIYDFDLTGLRAGVYIVKALGDQFSSSKKLVLQE